MSAIKSNADGRDLEALRRAQRDHEPSMDEILASIRNIIADDREPEKAAQPKEAAPRPATVAAGPQIVYSKEPLEPKRADSELAERPQGPAEASAPTSAWGHADPIVSDSTPAAVCGDYEPLLSPETGKTVGLSFGALSASLAVRSAEVADGIMREMLRPLLKQWLDDHLPGIVERLVRAEIQRIARGPG